MKKLILAVVLAAILATGTAFADHPSGFGIGVVGQFGWWGTDGRIGNGGLSLKIPGLPVFWAINFGAGSNHFAIGLTGDYYMIDQALPVQTLHWFLGLGGFFNLYAYNQTFYNSKSSYTHVNFGLRVPIGLSWQPIKLLELWFDIVPSFGIYIDGEGTYTYNNYSHTYHEGGAGFHWGLPLELGIRFWF